MVIKSFVVWLTFEKPLICHEIDVDPSSSAATCSSAISAAASYIWFAKTVSSSTSTDAADPVIVLDQQYGNQQPQDMPVFLRERALTATVCYDDDLAATSACDNNVHRLILFTRLFALVPELCQMFNVESSSKVFPRPTHQDAVPCVAWSERSTHRLHA